MNFKLALALLLCSACKLKSTVPASHVKNATVLQQPVTISILGTNDFHGNMESQEVTVGAAGAQQKTRIGGVDVIASYFNIARSKNPRTLVLDAGDVYQGTLISNRFEGKSFVAAFNAIGVDASTLGNHEFDYGARDSEKHLPNADVQGALKDITKMAKFAYLNANIKTKEGSTPAFPNLMPSKIFDLSPIKVGVIGAITDTTPAQTVPSLLEGLKFLSLKDSVPGEAAKLRAQGAHVVVLLTHAGGSCNMAKPAADGDNACALPKKDEITELLDSVPAGTIDAVVAGHNHLPQGHIIRGVPVVQTMGFGKTFSKIDITVDAAAQPNDAPNKRIGKIEISTPIAFCHTHFSNYNSCNPDEEKLGKTFPAQLGSSIPATFLGEIVQPKTEVLAVLKPYQDEVAALINKQVTTLPVALTYDRFKESPTSNCVADAITEQIKSQFGKTLDLGVFFSGGIRAALPEGKVNYGAVFAVLPFDGTLAVVKLTGAELEEFGTQLSNSPKNISVVTDGWKVQLTSQNVLPKHRGFLQPNGTPIDKSKTYTILTPEFNVLPGGAYEAIFAKVRAEGRIEMIGEVDRDIFAARLSRTDLTLPKSCLGEALNRTVMVP